ncbi:unnamed protein product [Ambrosiozyma monospora]|uniref:Unnamed protein product n=1 Tax=Ambrosiozyma monospora TaxID=43982 RepID=A0A9W6YZX0_AMBMO|nr:unnamed protein product [Ambrosiozyma monospora]
MTDILQTIQDQLESIPFFQEVMDEWCEYAEEHFNTKNPYVQTLPDGSTKKLKLPANATKKEKKAWKKIQRKAWHHDRCFMGCYPIDCGLGLAPILVMLPGIGPILMYAIHARLVQFAAQNFNIDTKNYAKMQANIFFDLMITLPPLLGTFLGWINACSTRNAAIIHTVVTKQLVKRAKYELMLAEQQKISATSPPDKGSYPSNRNHLTENGRSAAKQGYHTNNSQVITTSSQQRGQTIPSDTPFADSSIYAISNSAPNDDNNNLGGIRGLRYPAKTYQRSGNGNRPQQKAGYIGLA